jgi:hypothetical protein
LLSTSSFLAFLLKWAIKYSHSNSCLFPQIEKLVDGTQKFILHVHNL